MRLFQRVASVALLLASLLLANSPAQAEGGRYGRNYFPNIEVMDQDGRKHAFYDDLIHNKIVVVSFIYTTCRDICPLITARLAQVQEKLGAAVSKDVHFISISIDPENDTPALLKEHAQAFGVGPGWTFITGKPADIRQINYKLGERSQKVTDHGAEIVLGNDRTGQWARDSAFTDMNVLAATIRDLDPEKRQAAAIAVAQTVAPAATVPETDVLPGQALFQRACAACHTIGQPARIGPDLRGVTQKRDKTWLIKFVTDPELMRQLKDPAALELVQKYKNVRMPRLGLSATDAEDLIAYLAFQSFRADDLAAKKSAGAHTGHAHHHHGSGHKR